MSRCLESVTERGFAVLPSLIPESLRAGLLALFEGEHTKAGRRNGLTFEAVRAVAGCKPVGQVVQTILGDGAFAVKATLFDKTERANWLVPWHQDVMIPVRERIEVAGFDAWSSKGGIPHVRPPARVLESMIAVRLDLDGSTSTNGPLRVIPGTHDRGFLDADETCKCEESVPLEQCLVPASGGLVMRPLLLHASSKASQPSQRRIVHLEFAASGLPGGLDWLHRHRIHGAGARGE